MIKTLSGDPTLEIVHCLELYALKTFLQFFGECRAKVVLAVCGWVLIAFFKNSSVQHNVLSSLPRFQQFHSSVLRNFCFVSMKQFQANMPFVGQTNNKDNHWRKN